MTNILVFSPYALWTIHTIYEKTIAQSCQVRGANVQYLLCDGLLPECDLHWDSKATTARPLDLCLRCQAASKTDMEEIGASYRKLGEFVGPDATAAVFAWAQGLAPAELREATLEGMPLGRWVQSSVISYFRQYPPDLASWRTVNVYRGFLYSAAIVATGLTKYLKANQVDAALLFNGRQSVTRVAFEIFRQHGIRVLTHERAEYSRGHINVRPDSHCMNPAPFKELWSKWANVALDPPALEVAHKWLVERQTGTNLAWIPFNSYSTPETSIRAKLNIDADKKLWALFTSSTDETAGDPDLKGPYESQHVWVRAVLQWVAARPDVQLLIKVHPNLAGNLYIGKAVDELKIYEEMKTSLPENVKIVMPEDAVNAYQLAEEADLGLTFGSIIGLEMAMLGKPVLLASRALYENCSTIFNVRSQDSLPAVLDQCLDASTNRENQREAFRLAYCYVSKFELDFPALTVLNVYEATRNYSQPEELGQGRDASLDRICGYLIEGHPLYETPSAEDIARSTEQEDAFFERLANPPAPEVSDPDDPRANASNSSRNLAGRMKQLLSRAPFAAKITRRSGKHTSTSKA